MDARALNRRISVERATVTEDAFGNDEKTWSTLLIVWASKEDVSDGERWRAAQVQATITARFQFQWSPRAATITPSDRLVFDDRVFEIVHVKEIGFRRGVEITARARGE